MILKVEPGSSADAAGLRGTTIDRNGALTVGDIIVAIDNETVEDVTDLLQVLDERSIGDQVSLRIVRGGRQVEVSLVLQRDR